jgi:long-subunit fatty acid transport protein
MIRKFLILVILICLFPTLRTQGSDFNKVGTTAAQFLKIEVGARALGMGGCFGALANDASALYWNPAGFAPLDQMELSFTHTQWIAGISHGFAGFVIPVSDNNIFGLSFTYQSMDEMEQTTIEQPKGTGLYYDAQDIAVGLSYARRMISHILFGITAKMIHQSIWNETAFGFAVDIGLLLETGIKGTKVAMVMTNFGTDMQMDGRDLIRAYDQVPESASNPNAVSKLSTESWSLPTNLRISIMSDIMGAAHSFIPNADNRISLIIDATHPNDNPEHYNVGIEYGLFDQYFLRTGYRGNTDEEGITIGAGTRIKITDNTELSIDYAYGDFGVFNSVQHFSFGIKF